MTHSKGKALSIIVAIILYLFLSLTYLSLPGLQYDEVNFVNAAMGRDSGPFVVWAPKIFGKKIPLMIMSYIGALKSGLYAPLFSIFGTTATTTRLPVVIIGLLTLLMSYALFKRMFNQSVAVAALLLFATDPTFIFANRLDWGPVSLMLLLETGSLYCMWRWMEEEKRRFLWLAGLFFGLGLYNKIIFAWYTAAFFIATALLFRDHLRKLLKWRQLICLVPAFLIGCLPLIAYNVHSPMATFKHRKFLTSFAAGTFHERYELIRGTLDGSGTYFLFNQKEVAYHPLEIPKNGSSNIQELAIGAAAGFPWVQRSLVPLALASSLLFILIFWARGSLTQKRRMLFMVVQLLIITAMICITAEATGAHHVIAIYPFVFLVIAYASFEFGNWLGRSRSWVPGVIMSACLLPLLIAQLVIDARHLQSFKAYGGIGFWSDAIYDLASYARENPDKNFVLMGWGLGNQVALLSNGQIRFEEFECDPKEDLENCIDPLLARTGSILVFHAPPFGDGLFLKAYRDAVDRSHLYPHVKKTFFQRDGQPVYVAFETLRRTPEARIRDVYYRREAEEFDNKAGGALDIKPGASNNTALGNLWGLHASDFAVYRFDLPAGVFNARLYLRYAFSAPGEQSYNLLLDGQYLDQIVLPSTYGYGFTAEEWNIYESGLGYLPPGAHELRIQPARNYQIINLDYFVIRNPKL